MKKLVIVLLLFAAGCSGIENQKPTPADEIIAEYLKMPHPEKDTTGQALRERWKTLEKLNTTPETAIQAVRTALSKIENPAQRRELAGSVESFLRSEDPQRNEEIAKFYCDLLDDSDFLVRSRAIHGLRLLARRTDRVGPERRIVKESIKLKVEGLMPYLIKAAHDPNELNRVSAMYGLADTRNDEAVKELRKRLEDTSGKVRFAAACLLTEYGDASGLDEMKIALKRMQKGEKNDDIFYLSLNRGRLIASFERITGKSFGKIPLAPYLHSSFEGQAKSEKQLKYLIDAWAQWWDWIPENK